MMIATSSILRSFWCHRRDNMFEKRGALEYTVATVSLRQDHVAFAVSGYNFQLLEMKSKTLKCNSKIILSYI